MLSQAIVLLTTVWTADATTKIRPSDGARASATAKLAAARNEFEAVQVVVSGGPTGAKNVRMTASIDGFPQTGIWLYREALLNLTQKSNSAGATGAWPDPLIPDRDEIYGETRKAFPFDVPPNENRAVWVEVLVPPSQAAGTYSGAIHVTADGGFVADVPLSVEVWDFTLPSTPSLHTAFGSSWNGPCVAHGTPCTDDEQNRRWALLYGRFALDHRMTIHNLAQFGPAPTAGGYDWAAWDAEYAPYYDGDAPTRLQGAKLTTIEFVWIRDTPHYAAWARHFHDRGWFDRTFDYTCDEPPMWGCSFGDIPGLMNQVHQADPMFRTLVTTSLPQAQTAGIAGTLDTLVPVVDVLNPKDPDVNHVQEYRNWQAGASNRQVWWYFACEPASSCVSGTIGGGPGWPNYVVDAPAIENRIMGFLSYRYGITTELYYQTMAAMSNGDPWQSVYSYGNNGDGNLFYPGKVALIGGTHDVPVASIRLKMVREAREDYEYLKLLADAGDPQLAAQLAAQVAPKTWQFTEDPAVLYDARRQAAQRIVQLTGGSTSGGPPGTGSQSGGPRNRNPAGGTDQASMAAGCEVAHSSHSTRPWLLALLLLSLAGSRWLAAARATKRR
jgi:glycosyl hydrolase family 123